MEYGVQEKMKKEFGGGNTMEKEFYVGQPLLDKNTRERVTFVYDDRWSTLPCNVLRKVDGGILDDCYDYEDLEPSTEFKFSEIIAGLEQGYFEVGTEFQTECQTFVVCETPLGLLGLVGKDGNPYVLEVKINAGSIHKIWQLVESRKEMTLEEIEAELGYKIKLK